MLPLQPLRVTSNTYCVRTYCTITVNSTVNFRQVYRNFWLTLQKDAALLFGAYDVSVETTVYANEGEMQVEVQQTICPFRPCWCGVQVQQQWPATSVQPSVFVGKDRRLLSGAVHVLDTVVPCENSQSGVGWVADYYRFRSYWADQVNENEVGGICTGRQQVDTLQDGVRLTFFFILLVPPKHFPWQQALSHHKELLTYQSSQHCAWTSLQQHSR